MSTMKRGKSAPPGSATEQRSAFSDLVKYLSSLSDQTPRSRATKRRTSPPSESATEQLSAIPDLTAFLVERLAHEATLSGQTTVALHGDAAAARGVLQAFLDRYPTDRFTAATTEELALLISVRRLVGLMLDQPGDDGLSRALGYQRLRKSSERLVLDRTIFFAVEHAREGMGVEAHCDGQLPHGQPVVPAGDKQERHSPRVRVAELYPGDAECWAMLPNRTRLISSGRLACPSMQWTPTCGA
jgi:hypothetical protein